VSAPLLEVTDLRVGYGVAQALFDVSMAVEAGTVLAILGANGAGKSTIARAISGLVPVTSGTVRFAGEDITNVAPHRIRRAGLVHLPEGRGVFPGLTVAENLRMAAGVLPSRGRADAVNRGLDIFRPLADRRRQLAGLLSGGEQQMLSLARALILTPKLLVADEMSLGLAPKMVDLVFDSLERARTQGVAVILIEQFVHRALAVADSCILLQRGTVGWSGPAAQAKQEVLARYLGEGAA
jgi:branched-chain amino acid transport system ATP-binding protein